MLQDDNPTLPLLKAFTAPALDRCAFILAWLYTNDVPHSLIQLGNKKHIVIRFSSKTYSKKYRKKIFISHYDRVEQTDGANDNSAACVQLLLLSARIQNHIQQSSSLYNTHIIFTDGEEASGTKGIEDQGSFAIGKILRNAGKDTTDIFVFDACGRGDTLVISTQGLSLTIEKNNKPYSEMRKKFNSQLLTLHQRVCSLVTGANIQNWIRLPTPYSDNAGFISAGIPAQIITVLPADEAIQLREALAKSTTTELLHTIACNKFPNDDTDIPLTWKLMHTRNDTIETLDEQAFLIMEKFLNSSAQSLEPLP